MTMAFLDFTTEASEKRLKYEKYSDKVDINNVIRTENDGSDDNRAMHISKRNHIRFFNTDRDRTVHILSVQNIPTPCTKKSWCVQITKAGTGAPNKGLMTRYKCSVHTVPLCVSVPSTLRNTCCKYVTLPIQ